MTSLEPAERTFWRAAGARGAMFLVLWLALSLGQRSMWLGSKGARP